MNKGVYFIMGIVLASVGTAGYWALKEEAKPVAPPKQATKKISLLTINYIPTSPSKPIDEGTFWELQASPEGAATEKNLKDLKGKPIILHFWATWCGPCVEELPDLDIYAKKHENTAHIIAVATDFKDISKISEFYKAKGIKNLSITFDKGGVLSRTFRASALPTTVFINSNGHEIGRIQGAVEWTGTAGRLLNTHLSRN
ncbi:MAG: TlpA disulfide reductase family protein [Candidatus Paracaedibacter sp.]